VPSAHIQAVIAAAASTLFESVPFILAASFARRLFPKCGETLSALLSCGCVRGPGARSLAVFGLTALTFGALPAVIRLCAALVVARRSSVQNCESQTSPLAEVCDILPYAIGGSVVSTIIGPAFHMHAGGVAGFVFGCIVGFFAPCTLGAIALAATLRHVAFPAAVGILLTSGIIGVRTFERRPAAAMHDGFAYVIACGACVVLAASRGATLLNPRFTIALWLSAAAFIALAIVYRDRRNKALRWAPALMVAGTVCSHVSPAYTITETTLSDAAPGDAMNFRGAVMRDGHNDALVRYQITCCRADAQPVVVRLQRRLAERTGQWVDVSGTLISDAAGIALNVRAYRRVAAPEDPFIYR